MLHRFSGNIEGIARPERFTYPFCYVPHELVRMAAVQVQQLIDRHSERCGAWREEVACGKMFGVLVVEDLEGRLGFVAGFSGNIAGMNNCAGFVPPVYDMLRPDERFRREEAEISAINRRVGVMEKGAGLATLRQMLAEAERTASDAVAAAKLLAAQSKALRDERRAQGEAEDVLVAESRHERAELRRLKLYHRAAVNQAVKALEEYETAVRQLKEERRLRSAELQMWLFSQFRMLNARGEVRDLCRIFATTPQRIPPAGAGECAAPKMLQYAYKHSLKPIAMGEFWRGRSPKGEIRRDGEFYPSCRGKCLPILSFMLQGLAIDDDPMRGIETPDPEVLWEDGWLLAINKPAGMLSVDGLSGARSAEVWARGRFPECRFMKAVHRLDQATSGVLLLAKDEEVYKSMQAQFAARTVGKRYAALLAGEVTPAKGRISLPLEADYNNRPRQRVAADGAEAVTEYETVCTGRDGGGNAVTRVNFTPITGRTHQLRVHAAHPDGLGAPIVGDALYGSPAERMCLHAEWLAFVHPVTGRRVELECRADF